MCVKVACPLYLCSLCVKVACPLYLSAKDPYFDQGIGALNPGSDGSIDTYDFYPVWGKHRTLKNNILNLGGAVVGYGFGGDDYKIYPPIGE